MSPAALEARRWIKRAAVDCERACWRANNQRASEASRADARDRAEYWSGVAFHESARLVRVQRAVETVE